MKKYEITDIAHPDNPNLHRMQYGMWWSIVLHTMGSCHSVMEKH